MASRHRRTTDLPPLTLTERVPEQNRSRLEHAAEIAGRLIFGGYFLYSGIHHFTARKTMIENARAKGVSWPEAAVFGSGAMMVVGGLSLLTGVKPKVGASLVTAVLAGVTPGVAFAASAFLHRPHETA